MGDRARPTDRVPPHNLDAEASLLGACLLNRLAVDAAQALVRPDHFYKPTHARIYAAILALVDDGRPVDPVTVADHLQRGGQLEAVGGAVAVADLGSRTPATSNAAWYARIVAERAAHRALIAVGTRLVELGYEGPAVVDVAAHTAQLRALADRLDAIAEGAGPRLAAATRRAHDRLAGDLAAERVDGDAAA